MAQRVRCAMQARVTGDRRCLAFLVDLFVHEACKPEVSLDDYVDWFVGAFNRPPWMWWCG